MDKDALVALAHLNNMDEDSIVLLFMLYEREKQYNLVGFCEKYLLNKQMFTEIRLPSAYVLAHGTMDSFKSMLKAVWPPKIEFWLRQEPALTSEELVVLWEIYDGYFKRNRQLASAVIPYGKPETLLLIFSKGEELRPKISGRFESWLRARQKP